MEEEEEDRISGLPDSVLIDIISRLPKTKEAIRTGTLSKRWQNLWTRAHSFFFRSFRQTFSRFLPDIEKVVSQRGQLDLKLFHLGILFDCEMDTQVNALIRYAFSCNVKHLVLRFELRRGFEFELDQFFFINSSVTHMRLDTCLMKPTGAISWSNLKSLWLEWGVFNEDLIENILSGCPLLETFELENCKGFVRIDITSKSVKNLLFSGYGGVCDVLEINVPHILSLTIEAEWVPRKVVLLNVSSLVEAKLNYAYKIYFRERTRRGDKEEMFKGLVQSLQHVKNVVIGNRCKKTLTRLKAKGFTLPSNMEHQPYYGSSESEGDRISGLPDDLLIDIISRLPKTKEAIRTGTLSKRWQNLWTGVHNFSFRCLGKTFSRFLPDIEKVLSQRGQLDLKIFRLGILIDRGIGNQVNALIHYAFSCNVKHLDLWLDKYYSKFEVDQFFFINSSVTHMKLRFNCFVMKPTGAISWTNLKSLRIASWRLHKDVFENILSGSPLLEDLELEDFLKINITSKSVKNLVISGYYDSKCSEEIGVINAPHILSLTIRGDLVLDKFVLQNVSSLVEAKFNYYKRPTHRGDKEEMLEGLLQRLQHVKNLIIGKKCKKTLTRLKAKGFTFPSNTEHELDYGSSENEDWYDWHDKDSSGSDPFLSDNDNDSTESEAH